MPLRMDVIKKLKNVKTILFGNIESLDTIVNDSNLT